jgi:hypothetical protein
MTAPQAFGVRLVEVAFSRIKRFLICGQRLLSFHYATTADKEIKELLKLRSLFTEESCRQVFLIFSRHNHEILCRIRFSSTSGNSKHS